ncbi:MAG: methyltransferase [Leptospiraceae bacterium]|nr:methyltransferase [Leptospiraceae bacterium]
MNEEIREKLWKIASQYSFPSKYFIPVKRNSGIICKDFFPENIKQFVLELGSGWGEVAIELALKNPDTGYILMEKNLGRVKSTLRMIEKYKLSNIRFIPLNFNWFLVELLEPRQFRSVILNFPDPWPKKKHFKHRTLNEEFVDKLRYLLQEKGSFYFATDHGGYARASIRLFRKIKDFTFENEYTFQRDNIPKSRFEEEKRGEGKKIYYLERILCS